MANFKCKKRWSGTLKIIQGKSTNLFELYTKHISKIKLNDELLAYMNIPFGLKGVKSLCKDNQVGDLCRPLWFDVKSIGKIQINRRIERNYNASCMMNFIH